MIELQRIASAVESLVATSDRLREWFEAERVLRQRAERHARFALWGFVLVACAAWLIFTP